MHRLPWFTGPCGLGARQADHHKDPPFLKKKKKKKKKKHALPSATGLAYSVDDHAGAAGLSASTNRDVQLSTKAE